MTYRGLYWFSKLDLPKQFHEAVLAYKMDDLDNAFLICHSYINDIWFLQGLIYDPLSGLSGSDLINGFKCLRDAKLLTENSMRLNFNALARHNKPHELARAWVHLHEKKLLTGDEGQANLNLLISHQAPSAVGAYLVKLHENGLLTGEIGAFRRRAIEQCQDLKQINLSIRNLLISDNPALTAAQWYVLGDDYYFARNGKPKDYLRAKECYEQAITVNSKQVNALYSLGYLYEYGQGVDIDIVKSRKYYDPAVLEGDYASKKQLLLLDNPKLTAAQWHVLGDNYYAGQSGKTIDYPIAAACFEQAIKLDGKYAPSLRNPLIFKGTKKDFSNTIGLLKVY